MADKTSFGIDVSHNNGTVDWTKVEPSNPANSFTFIKATEGVGYTDPMCATNANAVSQKTRMRFGYYHFASLNNATDVSKDATDEANWFVQVMQTMPEASLLPVLDIERNDAGLTPTQVQEWISAFLSQMDVLGFPKVIIYSYVSFLNDNLPQGHPFGSLPLWIAHYTSNPSPTIPHGWTAYSIWQYSASGSVGGVSTACDLDKCDTQMLDQLKPVQRPSRSHTRPGRQQPNAPAGNSTSTTTNTTVETSAPVATPPATAAPPKADTDSGTATAPSTGHSGRKHLVSVKSGTKDRFVFFGLKLGHWLFLGVLYKKPGEDFENE